VGEEEVGEEEVVEEEVVGEEEEEEEEEEAANSHCMKFCRCSVSHVKYPHASMRIIDM
jgi:hypothetical protein